MDTHTSQRFEPQVGRSISLEQAAQILGVSRRTIYNRIRDGRLQTIRTLGGSQRVLLASVATLDTTRAVMNAVNVTDRHAVTPARVLRLVRTTAYLVALLVTAIPSFAAGRARLSTDLADHLAAGSQAIDVIVQGNQAAVDDLARRYAVVVKRRLKSGAVLQVNAGQLDAIAGDGAFDHYSGDVPIRSSMAITNIAIGADQVWEGSGDVPALTGSGVTVAVIDSGIDTKHSALRGRVLAAVDFTGGDGSDRFGHGTHVAAIIAGLAGRTPDTRDVQGVAAGAYLINLRVLGNDGSGASSNVLEAIDWAIEHKRQYHIGVINLSLGTPVAQPYRDDPLCQAVERAVASGIVVVASAGNFGVTEDGQLVYGGITSPGNDPYALTVGALNTHATPQRSDDTVAKYSSRGPTAFDLNIKPDVVAPGSHIESAEAAGSYLATTYPELHVAGSGPNAYMRLSGTSMAAGVVSGTVALLLQENARLSPFDVKAVVQLTSSFLPSEGFLAGGAGSLNAVAATAFVQGDFTNLPTVSIASETVASSGLAVFDVSSTPMVRSSSNAARNSIVWGNAAINRNSIVWGNAAIDRNSIVWGNAAIDRNSIVWGNATVGRNSIVWGNAAINRNSIVWGNAAIDRSSIVWGNAAAGLTSIVWGNAAIDRNSIVWGNSTVGLDSIVWGNSADARNSIVWGNSTTGRNSIVWGNSTAERSSIVWGNATLGLNSIVWGNVTPLD